jgi:DNA-binding SARP family transcriptional activator
VPNDSATLKFQLLGQVAGWRDGARLDFGSAHRRTVLAVLALHAGSVVSREQLVDGLWGDSSPASASGSIYTYVSSLRRALGDERKGGTGHQVLESVGSGYSLRVPLTDVDACRFDDLRSSAQRCIDRGEPLPALAHYDEALGLWHGAALAGLSGPFAEAQQARLGELRLATVEQRAELALALGRHPEVAAGLAPLVKEFPLRENLRGLLMRALHGCGRRTEALTEYADLRETLIQSTGTEPSPALAKLQEEILVADVAAPLLLTDRPTKPIVPVAASALRLIEPSANQPLAAEHFVGRSEALASLRGRMARVAVGQGSALLVQGSAGIGKSALLAEALTKRTVPGCRIAWAAADQLSPGPELALLLDCLGETGHPAVDRLAAAAGRGRAAGMAELTSVIREMCAQGPLILVTDDLQWADEATVLAWRRLIRLTEELPLLLVGACRPLPRREDLDQVRLDLAVRGEEVCTLATLSDASAYRLVEHITGAPPGRELRLCADRAAGNPFYVKEFLGGLVETGQIVVDGNEAFPAGGADRALPPNVGLRIAEHLNQLSPAARETVRWAALFLNEFTVADLAAAADQPASEIVGAVDEALRAGFLDERDECLGFRYPVVRMALYDTIPASMRVVLHRQVAEALAAAGSGVSRVAQQLVAAKAPADQWASKWLTDNIDAVAADSPHTAVALLRHAVNQTSLPDSERATLTASLARMLFYLGQEPTTEARLVLSSEPDSECAAEMRWILAYMHFRHGHRAEAAEEVRRTLADSELSDQWRGRHLRLRETLGHGDHCLPVLEVMRLVETDLITSDLSVSLPVTRRLAASNAIPGEVHLAGAVHSYWVGRWQDAAREVRTVLSECPQTSSYLLRTPGAVLLVDGLAATIAGHRGDVEGAREYLRTATQHAFPQSRDADFDPDAAGFLMAATAMLAEQEGRPEHALDALTPILDPYYPASVRHQWLAHLARLAVQVGDRERALHAMHAVQVVDNGNGIGEAHAVVAHCQGIVNQNPDQVLAAAAYYRTTDLVLQLGRSLEDAAALLAEHGRLEEGRSSFRTALTAYTRMGAGWDVQRAEDRMRPFGIRRANIASVDVLSDTA